MSQRTIVVTPGQTIVIDVTDISVDSFIARLSEWARPQRGSATEIYIQALAALVGVTDVEAVKVANQYARDHGFPTITTKEFRRWLPSVLSTIFAKWIIAKGNTPKGDDNGN